MTSFPFSIVHHPLFGILRRPLIPVRLIGPQRSLWQRMLLDSGADFTTLPAAVAEHLGFVLPSEASGEVNGIAGVPVPYVAGALDVEIGEGRFHLRVAWVLAANAPALLGRLDLFRQADVIFQETADLVTLAPPSAAPH